MDKVLSKQMDNEVFDLGLSIKENVSNSLADLSCGKKVKRTKSLSSHIHYLNRAKQYRTGISSICVGAVSICDDLSDKLSYEITSSLAKAIDNNAVLEVKRIKEKYGNTKEFAQAKDFLNKKCKEVWDVSQNRNVKLDVPKAAMKALGITNQPSLETLLSDSLKYYEKDNSSTTVEVISSILSNENIDYTFEDIYNYLKLNHSKTSCKYNFITVSYLASKLEYNEAKLSNLGVENEIMKDVFKALSFKDKFKYLFTNLNALKFCC